MDWTELGKWALAVIAALAAVGLVIKVVVTRKSKTTNTTRTVTQNNNKAGRDIVGGDQIDNSKR
ncbi:hypothetical protein [Polaromonas sp.]|uniref:hypothetical protein n=1 Tax=Polaromonas sp. TaxID=1869339 RepID=UPI00248916F4|nr:hypothetical protein [Polaromonas sp.]MDI1275564.1 hypothetical protein [Polaromonas sp.]